MHRFFCNSENISSDTIMIVDKSTIRHLGKALRLKPDEAVTVFDDKANEYECSIEKLLPERIILKIKNRKMIPIENTIRLTIACAIPKKSKFDDIIDKLTQLGVEEIIPMETERAIVKLDGQKEALRLDRWRKIALSASQQSQRRALPAVKHVMTFEKLLSESADFDLKLIPTLEGERKPLKEILSNAKYNKTLVLIGPEGDFSPAEVEKALKSGFIPVSLGDLVLRVETAAVAVASYIRISSL